MTFKQLLCLSVGIIGSFQKLRIRTESRKLSFQERLHSPRL